MNSLLEFQGRVSNLVADAGALSVSPGFLSECIRQALAEWTRAAPDAVETSLLLPGAGREIALNSLDGLRGVSAVWWPYDPLSAEVWPPNRVRGFQVVWDNSLPVLLLTRVDGNQPQAGEYVRLWYTRTHMIYNLDNGSYTTLQSSVDQDALVLGAAGYVLARYPTLAQGVMYLSQFRLHLAQARGRAAGSAAQPMGEGWKLDKWDT